MCCTGEGEREPGAASPEAHARFRSWRGRHPTGAIALTWAPSRRWPRGQVGGTSAALSLPIAGPVLSCTASASFHCAIGTTWPFRSLGMAVPGTASSALPESHAPLSPFSRQTAPGTRGQDQLSLSLGLARHPWEDNLGPAAHAGGFGHLLAAWQLPAGHVPLGRSQSAAGLGGLPHPSRRMCRLTVPQQCARHRGQVEIGFCV